MSQFSGNMLSDYFHIDVEPIESQFETVPCSACKAAIVANLVILCLLATAAHGQRSGTCAVRGPMGGYQHAESLGSSSRASNILYASAFSGSDICAKVIAAIGSSTNLTIDARNLGSQVCSTTASITLPANTTLELQGTQITTPACPAISISGSGVRIIGSSEVTQGYLPGFSPTIIKASSNTGCPLISDKAAWVPGGNQTAGLVISDLELDGNRGAATFGAFLPYSGDVSFIRLNVHDFSVNDIYATGGLNKMHDGFYQTAGGDGIVWGSDGTLDGKLESTKNGGAGLHILSGGNTIRPNTLDINGTHGLWLDGRTPPNWSANTAFFPGCSSGSASPSAPWNCGVIIPISSSNPGDCLFTAVSCSLSSCDSGSFPPTWTTGGTCTATIGQLIIDGQITWLNSGKPRNEWVRQHGGRWAVPLQPRRTDFRRRQRIGKHSANHNFRRVH